MRLITRDAEMRDSAGLSVINESGDSHIHNSHTYRTKTEGNSFSHPPMTHDTDPDDASTADIEEPGTEAVNPGGDSR